MLNERDLKSPEVVVRNHKGSPKKKVQERSSSLTNRISLSFPYPMNTLTQSHWCKPQNWIYSRLTARSFLSFIPPHNLTSAMFTSKNPKHIFAWVIKEGRWQRNLLVHTHHLHNSVACRIGDHKLDPENLFISSLSASQSLGFALPSGHCF